MMKRFLGCLLLIWICQTTIAADDLELDMLSIWLFNDELDVKESMLFELNLKAPDESPLINIRDNTGTLITFHKKINMRGILFSSPTAGKIVKGFYNQTNGCLDLASYPIAEIAMVKSSQGRPVEKQKEPTLASEAIASLLLLPAGREFSRDLTVLLDPGQTLANAAVSLQDDGDIEDFFRAICDRSPAGMTGVEVKQFAVTLPDGSVKIRNGIVAQCDLGTLFEAVDAIHNPKRSKL